jgi:ferric enterobactin receptor
MYYCQRFVSGYMVDVFVRISGVALLWLGVLVAQPPGGMGRPGGEGRPGMGSDERFRPPSEATLKGTIRGTLKDSATKEPLPYVSISLYRGDKLITGALSDENGAFVMREVPIGRYRMRMQPLGYRPTERLVETTPLRPDLNLGTLYLSEVGIELQTVEIQAERSPVTYQPEKIVYTPEKDPTIQGGDAVDALRKMPAVNVDLDGNIQVRGSGAVRIYVDGKPSLLFANNPGDALRAIPADQIERIELITNPSARYEAEGAVILNIVLKKNRLDGLTTSFNAGISTQFANGSAMVGAKIGRQSHTFNINGRYRYAGTGYTRFYRESQTPGGPAILTQDGSFLPRRFMTGLFYNGEFIQNAARTFSWGVQYRTLSFDRVNDLLVTLQNPALANGATITYSRRATFPLYDWGLNANLDYTYKSPTRSGEELFVSLQGGFSPRIQRYILDQLATLDTFFLRERSQNRADTYEGQFQADYTRPLGERWKVETGLRLNLRSLSTQSAYDRFNRTLEQFEPYLLRADTSRITQWVPASYVSLAWAKDRWLLKAGLRYEHTYNDARFLRGTLPIQQSFGNLLPSILLSYSVRGLFPIQLSYSQRIRRPWLRELNPFIDAADPRNISYGNPNLRPEITHSVEAGFFPFLTLFARYTEGAIENYSFVDATGVTNTTFLNAGRRGYYGATAFWRKSFWKDKITLQLSGEGAYVDLWADRGSFILRNTGYEYSVRGSIQWRPRADWIAELSGNYNSPRVALQGQQPVFMFQELGLRKTFAQGRWSVGAVVYNPFYQYLRFRTYITGPGFVQENITGVPFRLFGVQVRYQRTRAGENFWRRRRSGPDIGGEEW